MNTAQKMCELEDVIWDPATNILTNTSVTEKCEFGLGYDLFNRMQQNQEKIAQYIYDTNESDTYGSFLQRAIRTAIELKKRNLTKDDVVCICSDNHLNNCVPILACFFLGIPVTFLDTSFNVNDATPLINLVKPKVFFIVPEFVEVITECCKDIGHKSEIVVFNEHVSETHFTPFSSFQKEHESENEFKPVIIKDVSQTAVILFSSGTTGTPKGICCSHKSIYRSGYLRNFSYNSIFDSDPVFLIYSTFYWITAIVTVVGSILCGGARVVCKKFDPDSFWHVIEKYKVTWAFLHPIYVTTIISTEQPKDIDTSSFKVVVTGSTQVFMEVIYQFREILPKTLIFQGYGLTEAGGASIGFNLSKFNDRLLLQSKPTSCGKPLPEAEYQVINMDNGNICGPNERGELRMRSEFHSNGYYGQSASLTFDEEGWLRTGDIVYYDEEYCFYIVDRIKDMLKYKSWQVSPTRLEEILLKHPSVKQCVVVGIPDPIDGDLPLAVVVPHDSYIEKVTEDEIEKYVADRIHDSHRLRGGVKFVSTMPTTPNGKVKKRTIRDMILQGLI